MQGASGKSHAGSNLGGQLEAARHLRLPRALSGISDVASRPRQRSVNEATPLNDSAALCS